MTTLIYADYTPNAHEAEWVEAAFALPTRGTADWIIRASGITIVDDWPDGDDPTTALVISAWRE